MTILLLLVSSIAVGAIALHLPSIDNTALEDFTRKLDMSGVKVIKKMYDDYHNFRDEQSTDNDMKAITDQSIHHRVRRGSVILDQVKSARRTGNREELYIRSSIPHAKISEIYDPADIVPIQLTLDPPFNTIKPPMLFAVANHRSVEGSYQSSVLILRYNETSDAFTVHQRLDEFAPYELETFSGKINPMMHKNFLSVAGYIENTTEVTSRQPQVSIYEITTAPHFKFQKIQELKQAQRVRAMKYVEIGHITYLFLGNHYQLSRTNEKQYSSPSQLLIMRFDFPSNQFHFHSSLPGSGITDLECFKVRDKTYLTVANYRDNIGRLSIFSFIYSYNDQTRAFEMLQYLSTMGARDIEHFTLANEEYLVVANEASGIVGNKTFDVNSDIYKLTNGKFELIQKLKTYGAIKWKSIPVPNCKQDVLLVYSDQRDNVDQVGIYTFSHTAENFSAAPFSIYHLDLLNGTFRPKARTVSAYSLQDVETGSWSLYLVIGATDTTQGMTIYKLTYDINLVDSPLDAFSRDVERQLNNLNATLTAVRGLLERAKAAIEDSVKKSDTAKITGTKTIYNNVVIHHTDLHTLNITEGGMFHIRGNSTYRPGSLGGLEEIILAHNTSMNNILGGKEQFMYSNREQNITAPLTFNNVIASNVMVNTDVTVASNMVNNVDISDLNDIVRKSEDAVVTGYKNFAGHVTVNNSIDVRDEVNGLKFSRELVIQGIRQNITALKTFTKSINVTKGLNTGRINGVDIQKDALFTNQPAVVNDWKTFTSNVACGNCTFESVNGFRMEAMLINRVTKSTDQTIAGRKTFKSVTSNDNVIVDGNVNGFDLLELQKQLTASANVSVIDGDKIFTDNVTVTESIIVENGINNLSFPGDVLLKSSAQTIHASKILTNQIHFLKNVNVEGNIDGMDTKDFVTLETDQEIDGDKTFESVSFEGDLQISNNNTVNGIDLNVLADDIVTTTDDETLSHLTFLDTVIVKNSTVKHLINNDTVASFEEVFTSCLHRNGDQTINSHFKITNNVTVSVNMTVRNINGFSFPDDFSSTTANQTFTSDKRFQNIVMQNVVVKGTVNGIDVVQFNSDAVTNGDGTIYGVKTIYGDLYVNGSLVTDGLINGLNFSTDLLFYDGAQEISSHKYFKTLNFSNQFINVSGDVGVGTTIDGVDLSALELSGMTVSKNETVTGIHCFQSADYNRSVELVNNIDLSALRDDIVTVDTHQAIKSEKIFHRIVLEKNLNTTSTVDDVDVSQLKNDAILTNENAIVSGHVTFNQSLFIAGNLSTRLIDGTRMSSIRDDFVSLSADVQLDNLTVEGNVFVSTLNVTSINGVVVENIVYRSKEQIITGHKRFANVSVGDLHVNGLINGVNLTTLRREVVLADGNHTIVGEKVFRNGLVMDGNLDSSGVVNTIDMRNWGLASSSGNTSQVIIGKKTFVGENTTIHDLYARGTVNNNNLTSLYTRAVMSDGNHSIDHVIFENDVNIYGDLEVNGSVSSGLVQDVNLTELDNSVLKTVGDQVMMGKNVTGFVTVGNMSFTGFVNGLDVGKDLVTKATVQVIKGENIFRSVKVLDDVTVEGFVNNVNISELATDTLLNIHNYTQLITGNKTFTNGVHMERVAAHGLVDGLNITSSSFVTLHTGQVVYGEKRFTGDFSSNRLSVAGKVAGVNLSQLNRTRVLLVGDQTIASNLHFTNNLNSDENIQLTGLVNNVDLSEFNQVSPVIDTGDLAVTEKWLNSTIQKQCKSLTYIKQSLQASPFRLDYFVERESIYGVNIHQSEFFTIGVTSFLAYSIRSSRLSYCTDSIVARWNNTRPYLSTYQPIGTSGAVKIVYFRTAWNDHFLLVVNSIAGCPGIDGPTQLHKWNTTTSKFQLATPIPTTDAIDAVVFKTPTYVILFIANANDTLTTWLLTPTGVSPYSTLDSNPVTAHVFNINQSPYVAVASRTGKTSSGGFVNIYELNKGNMTKVQSIAARGASSVTSFTANGVVYIAIANDHGYSADGHSTYHLTVDVYSYSNSTDLFEWFRSIPTYRANRVTSYRIGSFVYLVVIHFDKSVSFYEFGLELGFNKVDELHVGGARDLTYMEVEERRFLFVASSRQVPPAVSKIMEILPTGADRRKVGETITCH